MTRKSRKYRCDSSWHLHATGLGLLGLVLVAASPSPALAAGPGEICGRIDQWSESCDDGLACELILRLHSWSIGMCVEVDKHCGGDLPEQCDETEYCAFEELGACGFADEPGLCEPRPQFCTEQYAPVCGCDGVSYGNACFAHAAGTAVQSEGLCFECDYEDPARRWVGRDRERCQTVRFTCEEGEQAFFDDCGCGCEPVPEACEYEGVSYPVGATFPAGDGCNECTCMEDGSVQCTLALCACDYEDPARSWVSRDPAECATVLFLCVEGMLPFYDDCGCGCEPACRVAGCSGQLCVGRDDDGISTCEFREEYACYADATCTLQPDGHCGFTPTPELERCIERARDGEP